MRTLEQSDPEVSGIIDAEKKRQIETLEIIASENYASNAVLEATGCFRMTTSGSRIGSQ